MRSGRSLGRVLASIALAASLSTALRAEPRYDVLIRGGRILDGTGNPFYYADVAIQGGKIAGIGDLGEAGAQRLIDASGMYVTPGFIDMHSHAMLSFHDPELRVDRASPRGSRRRYSTPTAEASGP